MSSVNHNDSHVVELGDSADAPTATDLAGRSARPGDLSELRTSGGLMNDTRIKSIMKSLRRSAFVALVLASALGTSNAVADEYFTLILENDVVFGLDNGYTNGLGVSWGRDGFDSFSAGGIPRWLRWLTDDLYISTMPGKRRAVSYTLAQTMHTPDDLTATELVEDEPPYAGILHGSTTLYAYDAHTADSLSLTLGVVGPASGADWAQTEAHRAFDGDIPGGWDHQLHNEVVFQLIAERLLRLARQPVGTSSGIELIGIGRGELGTIRSSLLGGVGLRYGRALDRSFPTMTTLPGRQVNLLAGEPSHSWNVFLNLVGGHVFNDIAIGGNTYRDSHSVPLKHWQAMAVAGANYSFGRLAVQFSTIVGSDRYEGESGQSRFGSISVTYQL